MLIVNSPSVPRKKDPEQHVHGLKDGDLTTTEGRCRLYDKLTTELPMHVWLSPKCRAWCRWNVFNMNRNPKTAYRIMKARKEDLVHLLLCDAIFQFQRLRQCHAHLEQPVGSEMLLQAELQDILEQSLVARCDMCVAGQLSNPETGERIKKGTQVLTTSYLMYDLLNKLRCDGQHSHHQSKVQLKVLTVFAWISHNMPSCTLVYSHVESFGAWFVPDRSQKDLSLKTVPWPLEIFPKNPMLRVVPKDKSWQVKQPPTPFYQELEFQERIGRILQAASDDAPKVG